MISLDELIHYLFQIFTEEEPLLIEYLNEANNKTIRITKILAIYLPCTFLMILASMGIVNIAYCLLVYGHIDGEQLYFPYQFV